MHAFERLLLVCLCAPRIFLDKTIAECFDFEEFVGRSDECASPHGKSTGIALPWGEAVMTCIEV